ncbi:hypothetical protein J2Z32_001230 [Paenibacillus turicensis]|uniref:VanZ-like domain-containing protein n=1 Tax=Paenibacillus turicensis TaxID=160487 RepID=A0ABS4FPU7_9BACL|nr:hypothetical protein [Paenibacillus turicensis]MBP1904607.1 hypothetical protein [Paenibacillus turicensis]
MKKASWFLFSKAPWHLWVIASIFLFIYANGVYDYFMMLGLNEDYYTAKNYGEAVINYFSNYPVIPLILYTINIFSGVLAPCFLLLRLRWAVTLAGLSAFSILGLEFITFTWMNRWDILGAAVSLFDIFILLLTFAMYLYSKFLLRRGVLK